MAKGFDRWYITRRGSDGRFAAIFQPDHRADPRPDPEQCEEKYLFATLGEAVNYASRNYVSDGIVLDENL